jgi:arylsulfatase A-like enzyme
MRGKGNSVYRSGNYLPLMIVHPAYPHGKTCAAATARIDITLTVHAAGGRRETSQACAPNPHRSSSSTCAPASDSVGDPGIMLGSAEESQKAHPS